jgi:hypothetical protein
MDNEKTYVEKVKDWLNAESRSIEEGAKLMLQGNKNRILHENVIRKNNFAKIEYELKKILGHKCPINVIEQVPAPVNVQELEIKVKKIEEEIESSNFAGKRADHDSLPAGIQLLVEKNLEIYHEIRSRFERLKMLSEDGHTAEERLPFLQELLTLETSLISNWEIYDDYDTPDEESNTSLIPGEKIDAKRVSADRKYLSSNKSILSVLIDAGNTEKVTELRDKMQERYNELILNGETFAADQVAELKALGVIVCETGETTEDVKTEPAEYVPATEGSSVENVETTEVAPATEDVKTGN